MNPIVMPGKRGATLHPSPRAKITGLRLARLRRLAGLTIKSSGIDKLKPPCPKKQGLGPKLASLAFEFKPVQANSSQFKQIQASSSEFKQLQEHSSKFKKIQARSRRFRRVQPLIRAITA
ncbi:MAG: hypothetical protein FJX47_18345 [Alphaproteobacteria bacterium]|nr:hypothetical protein [Alphaproteobacteria bacterium]